MATIVSVSAGDRLTDSGIDVLAGSVIRVSALGQWTDWMVRTDADGFEAGLLGWAVSSRRIPNAPWFRLCGAVGRDERHLFALGREATVEVPASGRLFLFANDIHSMYWNNSGTITVTVVRVSH